MVQDNNDDYLFSKSEEEGSESGEDIFLDESEEGENEEGSTEDIKEEGLTAFQSKVASRLENRE